MTQETDNLASYQKLDDQVYEIEKCLYQPHRSGYEKALIQLGELFKDAEKKEYGLLLQQEIIATHVISTRLAGIYIHLFLDHEYRFSIMDIVRLTLQKRFFAYVFEVSGYGSANFLLRLLEPKIQEKQKSPLHENPALIKSILLSSSGDLNPVWLVELSLSQTEVASLLILGLLLDRIPVTLQGEAARKFLLEECNPYKALRPLDAYRNIVSNVWMLCSYSSGDNKHIIKKHLNEWFERVNACNKNIPKALAIGKSRPDKKVIAVAAESFGSNHAMFRWYGPIVQQLRQTHHMVLVASESDVDDSAKAMFDEYLPVNAQELNLQDVLHGCSPDVVYFPSVGMRAWSIALANIRWAPLQLMSLGHPATTHSACIDGLFVDQAMYSDGLRRVIQENILVLQSPAGKRIKAIKGLQMPERQASDCETIRIAIPCNVMKINLPFLVALKEIESLAHRPVQFSFFPNEFGLSHISTTRRIQSYFPNAFVAKRMGYNSYLSTVNNCDFALSPFPFGNASSIIDCFVLGLPVIAMNGDEPHSRSDYVVSAAFELQDYFIANNVHEYVNAAATLINDPQVLAGMRQLVQSRCVADHHVKGENDYSDEFCQALDWAYEHREQLINTHGLTFEALGRWVK